MAAEPAPRKRIRCSLSWPPVILSALISPASSYPGRALDVVVVAGHLVAVAGQQGNGIDPGPVLEVDATVREDLLHRLHELVHEGVQLFGRGALLPQADVERIAEIGFVVGAGIQVHRQQARRRHARRRRVELQLADRNAHAVGAQVAQAEDAAGVGHADEPHVFDRPVAQHFPDVPLAGDRQIHPVRAAEDVVELQAGLADRRVVHDLEEAGRVRHQGAIEQRLVRVEQIHQVDEPVEVGGLFLELQQDTAQLSFNRLRHVGNQPDQPERLALGLRKAGGLVDSGVVQDIDAAFAADRGGRGHGFSLLGVGGPSGAGGSGHGFPFTVCTRIQARREGLCHSSVDCRVGSEAFSRAAATVAYRRP